jgi:addiction module HigA family antidote
VNKRIVPVYPGTILLEDYIKPSGIPISQLAQAMQVPTHRIFDTCKGKHTITANIARCLGIKHGTSTEILIRLQLDYASDRANGNLLPTG